MTSKILILLVLVLLLIGVTSCEDDPIKELNTEKSSNTSSVQTEEGTVPETETEQKNGSGAVWTPFY